MLNLIRSGKVTTKCSLWIRATRDIDTCWSLTPLHLFVIFENVSVLLTGRFGLLLSISLKSHLHFFSLVWSWADIWHIYIIDILFVLWGLFCLNWLQHMKRMHWVYHFAWHLAWIHHHTMLWHVRRCLLVTLSLIYLATVHLRCLRVIEASTVLELLFYHIYFVTSSLFDLPNVLSVRPEGARLVLVHHLESVQRRSSLFYHFILFQLVIFKNI